MVSLIDDVRVLSERLNNLEKRFKDHERRQNNTMEKIKKRLEVIDEKLDGRPSWPVAIIITVLSSALVGFIVGN